MSSRDITAAFIGLQLICFAASAQPVPAPVPPTVQPGAIERQQNAPPEPLARAADAPVQVQLEAQKPPANAASISFDLKSLEVTGNTALPSSTLLATYSSLAGTRVSVEKIYSIANEMTARYRDAGYILSSVIVPPQTITDGRVLLQVVEGYLSEVRFEGDVGNRSGLLDTIRSRLVSERPLHVDTLERYALLLNDLPETTAQFVLARSESAAEAAALTIRMSTTPVTLSLAGSNRGSRVQGPIQANAKLDFNSLFGLHESTSLQYMQAEESKQLQFLALSHQERLTASGLDLRLTASKSDSSPELGADFQQLNLETDTKQARIELSMPLLRSRVANVHVRGALTYHDGATETTEFLLTQDKIAAARIGLSWDGVDVAAGVNLLDLEYSHGLEAFGASEYRDPLASRAGGRPDFSKATIYLARLQSLGAGFSALLAINGQYAATNLLAPEEFAFGGEYFGRAYDPSELVGDSGAAGKLELRYTFDNPSAFSFTVYGFGEKGKVWRRLDASEVGAADQDKAESAGGGVRVSYDTWLTGYVEAAVPIDRVVAAEGDDDTRVFGGLQFIFNF